MRLLGKKKNYLLDWDILNKLDQEQLIDTICMVSPLSVEEKQKLLETKNGITDLSSIKDFDVKVTPDSDDYIKIPNNVLQGDFKQAGINTGRFIINTTLGILGIFDVAEYLGLSNYEKERLYVN